MGFNSGLKGLIYGETLAASGDLKTLKKSST